MGFARRMHEDRVVPGVLVSLAALNASDGPDDRRTPCLVIPSASWLLYLRL